MNKMKYIGILVAALILAVSVQAQQLQKAAPKYDEQEVERLFKVWVDGLDTMAVTSDYKKPIRDLLSADIHRQTAAIETLGSSGDIRVIPWLFPFINQENNTLRIFAGLSIEKVISAAIHQKPDGRAKRATSLKPTAWIALQMFRKPDDGNTWCYASNITRLLRMKEFEDELTRAMGSKHPSVSEDAKNALESFKGKANEASN